MKLPLGLGFLFACALGAAAVACGSTSDSGSSSTKPPSNDTTPPGNDTPATSDPEAPFPADHPALPQVASQGGPVLATPKIIPVFFPGVSFRSQVVDYLPKLGKSTYWSAVTAEYGVGAAETLAAIDVSEASPATLPDSDIQAWLKSRFDGTHPEFGTAPVAGAVYTLFYPATTTIYLGSVPTSGDAGAGEGGAPDSGTRGSRAQTSCKSFGGYHQDVNVNGVTLAYAVIPECTTFGPLSGVDVVTGTTSHELVEAATDPFPISKPAYATVDDAHLSWTFALGAGEVGDMCAQYDNSFYKDPVIGYTVQRSWSNAAAKAGSEPCVPALPNAAPYFNAAPVLSDNVDLAFGTTKGVRVPVGQSKTIELDLFSSAATSGPWTVSVVAAGGPGTGSGSSSPVTFSLDKSTGKNGDKLNLTIEAKSAVSSRLGGSMFVVVSSLGSERHYWAGVVGN